jgi:chaperonin cofactor prefoldin
MSGQGNNKTCADIARPTKKKFPPKEELEKCISNSQKEIRSLKEQLGSVNQKFKEVSKKIEDGLVIENSEGLPGSVPRTAIAVHDSYIREITVLLYDEDFLNQDLENAQFNLNWAKKQLRELEKISSSNE